MRSSGGRRGQALVLFALFLLVLIGASALAIDYANWLLIDRQLQNVTDHAALAGAADFSSDFSTATCGGGSNPSECVNARAHAWTAIFQDIGLGDPSTDANAAAAVSQLAQSDSPAAGVSSVTVVGHPTITFNRTIWVSTPPPSGSGHTEYTGLGGRYSRNYGVMFVRVDEPTRSYLAGVFGITVNDRIGWATAGILPTDFALDVFCRDQVAPEHGVCANSSSLAVDGGGGISLDKGDVGSSNSLKVTQQGGSGVVVKKGNVFLVEGTCGSSTWNCPPATAGGISDGAGTAKNAFYIPPIPVPNYALPSGIDSTTCASSACVPGTGSNNATPMDWSCVTSGAGTKCGTPTVTTTGGTSTIQCAGTAGSQTRDLRPSADISQSPNNSWGAGGPNKVNGSNIYPNFNETAVDPSGTTLPSPPSGATTFPSTPVPQSYVSSNDGSSTTYIASLSSPNGTLQTPGFIYLRFVLFKTLNNTYDSAGLGNTVSATAELVENVGGSWVSRGSTASLPVTSTITAYQVPAVDVSTISNPSALGIRFVVTTTKSTGSAASDNRGAGISWAEALLDKDPVPPPPPMIPPGMYRSITIPAGGCAVLDPTAYYSGGLQQNQMPGIYYFKDGGNGTQKPTISLGSSAFLIGDGVSLVFADNWPNPTGTQGIALGSNAALVINSATTSYNPSSPLPALASDALSAAWEIDPETTTLGHSTWNSDNGCANTTPCVLSRTSDYVHHTDADGIAFRGVSFYFRPKTNGSTDPANYSILGRFSMSGTSGSEPGIAFRGIMYAPYDDVVITGGNGFNTIGMVLSWTAKFAGQATIKLDYPYTRVISPPYLLEPTVGQ
jgi:Flp pilus assembly protein TadG